MKKIIFIFWFAMLLPSMVVQGGAFRSGGEVFAIPVIGFMAHAFFRNDPVNLSAAWQESASQKQMDKNKPSNPEYLAVITCPPKRDSSKKTRFC